MNNDCEMQFDKLLDKIYKMQRIMNAFNKEYFDSLSESFKKLEKGFELMSKEINISISQSLSDNLQRALEALQPVMHNLNESQLQEGDTASEKSTEKTLEAIENTANLLEENGVDSSQVQDFKSIKNKKHFTINEIAAICTIISFVLQLIQFFSEKDTIVNNYSQNTSINYSINITENESVPTKFDETDINQMCDHLSTVLESLLTPQDDSYKSEESPESAYSPLPEPKVGTDTQETTEISTPDNH